MRLVDADELKTAFPCGEYVRTESVRATIDHMPSAEPERHYCRECKWSRCHIDVDKYGKSETYWHCLNWDGGTDEEGFCHEWKRREGEEE